MTTSSNRIARPLRLAALALAPGSFCVGSPASADTRAGANVSAGASTESNPYLSNTGTDVALSLSVEPWLQLSNDISSLNLQGTVSMNRYTKNSNGTDIGGSLNLSGSHRLSPYVGVSGGVNYFTSLNGINRGFPVVSPVSPTDPLVQPVPLPPDISFAGTRTRTHSISGNLGFSARLSPRDSIGVNFSASRSTNGATFASDYTGLGAGLNYSRPLSEHISATASITYNKSNFIGSSAGDGETISPQAGLSVVLSPRTTLSASLGASFTSSDLGNGAKQKSTSLSGQMTVCRSHERGVMCLLATRSAQPSAIGKILPTTTVSANYSERLSARDSVTFDLGFSSSKSSAAIIGTTGASKYYSAGGSWTHDLGRRLSIYVSPGFSRISGSSRSFNSYRISAGIRYSFGATS